MTLCLWLWCRIKCSISDVWIILLQITPDGIHAMAVNINVRTSFNEGGHVPVGKGGPSIGGRAFRYTWMYGWMPNQTATRVKIYFIIVVYKCFGRSWNATQYWYINTNMKLHLVQETIIVVASSCSVIAEYRNTTRSECFIFWSRTIEESCIKWTFCASAKPCCCPVDMWCLTC